MGELHSLRQKFYAFITNGLHHIRAHITEVSPSESHEYFLQTYEFLIDCLKVLSPIFPSNFILYDHWESYIGFFIARNEFHNATTEIHKVLKMIGGIQTGSILPSYNMTLDEGSLNCIFGILLSYLHCLLQSEDFAKLIKVVEELDPWLKSLDEDMRTWIVELLIKTMDYNDDEFTAQRFAVTLLEHAKVSKDVYMIEMGTSLVRKGNPDFFRRVLEQLALKCPLEIGISEETNEWATCMMQLESYAISGSLHPTICIIMQSMILDHHLKVILCDKDTYLLEPMNFIEKARACREQGTEGLDDCLHNLSRGIKMLVSYCKTSM
ncbi:hypothetical protein Tco_0496232 [Tanacetum coccineum]